jgi:hypothetical protein
MGQWTSRQLPSRVDISKFYLWVLPSAPHATSPVFIQSGESFVASWNAPLATLFIYSCNALQWHFDEFFSFKIEIRFGTKPKKRNSIRTTASFTHNNPFVGIVISQVPTAVALYIEIPPDYPYLRNDRYIGFRNSGSTCYIASVLQILCHIGAFRKLLYRFRNPPAAASELQQLFVQLQISTRPLTLDAFIESLGAVYEIASVQQDAHEFFTALMERLEHDLGEEFESGIAELFQVSIKREIVQNGKTIELIEKCISVPIPVEGHESLRESLDMMGAEIQSNYEGNPAVEKQSFCGLPPVLIFQLCRYKYDAGTNSVIELRTPFRCSKKLDLNGQRYVLFAVIAHSGTPTFGHYMSFIRVGVDRQWYSFDDSSVQPLRDREVMNAFDGGSSQFRTITFGSPLAYIVFYVRADSISFVKSETSIPLYLAPHKSSGYYSVFTFHDNLPDQPLVNSQPPVEWDDPEVSLSALIAEIRPDFDQSAVSAWAKMPGSSQFIGPLQLSEAASSYVVRGLPTVFFILSRDLDEGPIFVSTERPPRKYVTVSRRENLPRIAGWKYSLCLRNLPRIVPPGTTCVLMSNAPLTLDISGSRYVLALNLTYSEVQTRVSAVANAAPERILLMNSDNVMTPSEYPYVSTFPHAGHFSFQILNRPATVCSIALYHPLSFVFISPLFVREHPLPVWVPQNSSVHRIAKIIPKYIPELKMDHRMTLQCSRGTAKAITKPFVPTYHVRDTYIRLDLIRHEVARDRWRTAELLKAQQPFSVEVRHIRSRSCDEFLGVSRLLTIRKHLTVREIAAKMAKLDNTYSSTNLSVDVFLFSNERPALQQDLALGDVLFEAFPVFLEKLTIPNERICIGVMVKDAVDLVQIQKGIPRSQSSHMELYRLITGK